MMKLNQIAAALGAVALGLSLAGPASAQVGDSKADPRNRVQGPTDNPNTSANPVGQPNSTNVNRCSHLNAASKEHADCMANLRRDGAASTRRDASSGASATTRDRAATGTAAGTSVGRGTNEGRGITQNENTSQNPNTGGNQRDRGGDSNINKAAPGASSGASAPLYNTPGAAASGRVDTNVGGSSMSGSSVGSTGAGANANTGITQNPNTSANPNTGGSGVLRGGDSGRAPQGGN